MPSNTVGRGNLLYDFAISVNLVPVSTAANSTSVQTFTGSYGLSNGDLVQVGYSSTQASGILINSAFVSSTGALVIAFYNASTGTVTPSSSAPYTVSVNRPENLPLTGSGL